MPAARRCPSPSCGSPDVIVGRPVWTGWRECACRVCWTEWREPCERGIVAYAKARGARNAERVAEAVAEAGPGGVLLCDLAQDLFFQRRTVRRHARRLAAVGRIVIESDGRGAWMLRPVAAAKEASS
jgi:hypothetical protein